MQPKPVYHALDGLINGEWTTRLSARTDERGIVRFRGFRGRYRISWTDRSGQEQSKEYHLK